MFRRQLKVPLIGQCHRSDVHTTDPPLTTLGMDGTLEEYKSFSEGAASKESISDYELAKKRLEQLLPFEADMVRYAHIPYIK